jgi:peptidyl-prolyl cis-trans isomerase SurA
VERVVAVVGDSAIFYTDVLEFILSLEASGQPIPEEAAARRSFERDALTTLVNESLVLQAASKDSLSAIPPERVDAAFEESWNGILSSFNGSEANLRIALEEIGRTVPEHRTELRRNIHNQLLQQRYMQLQQQASRTLPVDEAVVREYYESNRTALQVRPATITFSHVLLTPVASDSSKTVARTEAERILGLLRDGEDFAELARRFSADGSAQQGGELGWVRTGETVPEFDAMVFALGRGQTSPVVETQYGSHIIRVERIASGERFVRHILIAAAPVEADIARTRAQAQAIRDSISAGTPIERFMANNAEVGLPEEVTLPLDQLGEQLPASYAQALRPARVGDVLGPITFLAGANQTVIAVASVTEVRQEGAFTYEDLREQIRTRLQEQRFVERLYERLAAQTHVEVRW